MTEEEKLIKQKENDERIKKASKKTREQYHKSKITDIRYKNYTIRTVDGEDKEKTIEERVYQNGVKKRNLVNLKKGKKVLVNKERTKRPSK